MGIHHFFDPTQFWIEFIYTTIVVILFFYIYFKTKDIFNLTKYKGIKYFRNAFLLFGLAYVTRFFLHLLQLYKVTFNLMVPLRFFFPFFMAPLGYLSTLAIFYLTYSTIWKKIKYKHFIIFSNITAIIISVIAFVSNSFIILSLFQLSLLLFAVIIGSKKRDGTKERKNTRILYLLVSLFWLINIFVMGPRRLLPFEVKIIFQILSLFVFIGIYYKFHKWIR